MRKTGARRSSRPGFRPSTNFWRKNQLAWPQVQGVGLAIPGPYERYGVLDKTANLPMCLAGWNVHADFSAALAGQAGRPLPLVVGNDGNYGGVAEARLARGDTRASVLMLMPGSGLGAALSARTGFVWMATRSPAWKPVTCPQRCICSDSPASHLPAAADATGAAWKLTRPFPGCRNCSRKKIKNHPGHELAQSAAPIKEKVLSLRTRAQQGDALALEIFDFQARVMGLHVANLVMAFDPGSSSLAAG